MDNKRRQLIKAIGVAPVIFAIPAIAKQSPVVTKDYGSTIREHSFRLSNDDPATAPGPIATRYFADYVNKASKGKISIKTYPSSVLGKENAVIGSIQSGIIDFALMGSPYLTGLVEEYRVLDVPYSFDNSQHAYEVLDGPVGTDLLGKLKKHDITGLGFWEIGFRDVTNNKRSIRQWEDLDGLKIRTVPSPIFLEYFKSLGANPVPMSISEVYTALSTGTISAQANPPSIIDAWKFYEVQKYLSLTNHIYTSYTFMASPKTLAKLNDEERAIIEDAALSAREYQRKLAQKATGDVLAALQKQMQVNTIEREEIQRFRNKALKLYPEFRSTFENKEFFDKWIKTVRETSKES